MKLRIRTVILLLCTLLLPLPTYAEVPDDLFTDEEVVVEDRENGHWSYSSEALSIVIDRHETKFFPEDRPTTEMPLVYLVAHIYMREYSTYRSGFADDGENGTTMTQPYKIVRKNKAVLAITGDNMINAEQEWKGALIRHGRVYSNYVGEAVMAFTDNDMAIQVFERGEIRAEELLEMGVRDTYSFGPWLIKNGVPNDNVHTFRVNRVNPRVGLGMIEPGHLVAIVADGRQNGYSYGLTLTEFRDLFVKEGCVQAFNLDGGCSTGMLFMGEHLNQHDGRPGAADYQRPWVDALMWGYSDLVPDVNAPLQHNGNAEVQ